MYPTLHTPRLLLVPVVLEDAEQIEPLFAQWEVVRYLNSVVPWPYPPGGARQFLLNSALPAIARGDSWFWTIRRHVGPDHIIGCIDLRRGEEENRGFWIAPAWQGQGFATEASIAVTDYWFDVLGMSVLRVPKAISNTASRLISERQGMRLIRREERDFVCGRLPAEIWEITADEWRRYRALRGAPVP
jgi:[ribosomal protein S5]-alanine N-acetyltransferase